MSFFEFDSSFHDQFDSVTRKQLEILVQKFGRVEMRELVNSKEWCVRVVAVDDLGDRLPLAALGDTALEAAERLIRISQSALGSDNG